MSATIIAFPFRGIPPQAYIETMIERLIDLLDTGDQGLADLEPDDDCEPDDWNDEPMTLEWHLRSLVTVRQARIVKRSSSIR